MPTRDPSNLTMGVGYLYRAPLGTAEPADNTAHVAPAAPWVDLGFTDDGITLTEEADWETLTVDQVLDDVDARLTGRRVTVETALAEPTLDAWKAAINDRATLATVAAAGAGTTAAQTLTPGDSNMSSPTRCMIILDGFAPGGFARRLLMRRVLQIENIEHASSKTDKGLITVKFQSFYVSSSVRPYKIIDQTAAAV